MVLKKHSKQLQETIAGAPEEYSVEFPEESMEKVR